MGQWHGMAWKGWSENILFEQTPEWNEEENQVEIWGKEITGGKNSRGKGTLGEEHACCRVLLWTTTGIVCRTIKPPYLRLLFLAWAPGWMMLSVFGLSTFFFFFLSECLKNFSDKIVFLHHPFIIPWLQYCFHLEIARHNQTLT